MIGDGPLEHSGECERPYLLFGIRIKLYEAQAQILLDVASLGQSLDDLKAVVDITHIEFRVLSRL
jgi:hypothetical protein